MWKKEGMPDPMATPRVEPAPAPRRDSPATPDRAASPKFPGDRATIGRSITIRGEVTGDEDLLIQGRIDGSVNLKQHSITVGAEGEVKADIVGRVVTVEGSVEGNLTADEQVILRNSAQVQGDITAPRVVLEDGARFRGGIDMGDASTRSGRNASTSQTRASTKSETGKTSSLDASHQLESSAAGEEKSETAGSRSGSSYSVQSTR